MQALLSLILGWLVLTTGLPAAELPPRVELVSAAKMAEVRHLRLQVAGPSLAGPGQGRAAPPAAFDGVHAIYDAPGGTVYLSEGWRADSPADVSILVHELVHHLQFSGGIGYPCAEAREGPAYQAQERWLNLFGSSLADSFGLDAMTLLVRTRCMH